MSVRLRIAAAALLTGAGMVLMCRDELPAQEASTGEGVVETFDAFASTRLTRSFAERMLDIRPEYAGDYDWTWETDPAVLSRSIDDTMPSSPGVWSTPRPQSMTIDPNAGRHKESDLVRQRSYVIFGPVESRGGWPADRRTKGSNRSF